MAFFYIRHLTHYRYTGKVVDSANQVKLYPVRDERQRVTEHAIEISENPEVHVIYDYFGNKTGFFTLIHPHRELRVENRMAVEIIPTPMAPLDAPARVWAQLLAPDTQLTYHPYLKAEQAQSQKEIDEVVQQSVSRHEHPLHSIVRLSDFIYQQFAYKKGVTTIETSVDDLWKLKAGVCQDFAHLLLYMLRLVNIPCRYISGYICPGSSEWRGEGATHAWAEAWMPDIGWVGVDPTNQCLAGERHVRLASGRNFSDCTPVKGTYRGAVEHILEVTVQFSSEPFTDRQRAEQAPTFVNRINTEGMPQNSYTTYLQMQQ
ncbi:MAG: transglutaminase family protein [Cyclobacteriaceae bacterium]|nr:transglutaminase family protein [Cyclobacteriaceae bacterium]